VPHFNGKTELISLTQCDKEESRADFCYHNELRIVEPQCHGISSADSEILRAVQLNDAGRSEGNRSNV
jgi:hypothetical protein